MTVFVSTERERQARVHVHHHHLHFLDRFGGIPIGGWTQVARTVEKAYNLTGRKTIISGDSGGSVRSYAFLMSMGQAWVQKYIAGYIGMYGVYGGVMTSMVRVLLCLHFCPCACRSINVFSAVAWGACAWYMLGEPMPRKNYHVQAAVCNECHCTVCTASKSASRACITHRSSSPTRNVHSSHKYTAVSPVQYVLLGLYDPSEPPHVHMRRMKGDTLPTTPLPPARLRVLAR